MKRRIAVTGAALITLRALRGFKVGDEVKPNNSPDGYAVYAKKRASLGGKWHVITEVGIPGFCKPFVRVAPGTPGMRISEASIVAWRPGKEK
jgi:hypothetical protein